jgi:hypothetical protein
VQMLVMMEIQLFSLDLSGTGKPPLVRP